MLHLDERCSNLIDTQQTHLCSSSQKYLLLLKLGLGINKEVRIGMLFVKDTRTSLDGTTIRLSIIKVAT